MFKNAIGELGGLRDTARGTNGFGSTDKKDGDA